MVNVVKEEHFFNNTCEKWDSLIFEGAQGILLDQNHGNRPYITKSNTTSRNAIRLIDKYFDRFKIETTVNYVTRAYHTRHGAGPFHHHAPKLKLYNNNSETNGKNKYQGKFFTSYLDVDLVNYALECDQLYSIGVQRELTITCTDHFRGQHIPMVVNNQLVKIQIKDIENHLNSHFSQILVSVGPYAESITDVSKTIPA